VDLSLYVIGELYFCPSHNENCMCCLCYNVEGSNLEVNSNGRKEAIVEDIIGESQQKG